jgi:hypothetical protein
MKLMGLKSGVVGVACRSKRTMKSRTQLAVSCCLCVTAAQPALADFVGAQAVIVSNPDVDSLCVQANGANVPFPLQICQVFLVFSDPTDRLLSVGNADIQVFSGVKPGVFFQNPFGSDTAPNCSLLPVFPDLVCDSYVTIGVECNDGADGTTTDGDFDSLDFNSSGHLVGGWFNSQPPNGQGDAGNYPSLRILLLQSSVAAGSTVSGAFDVVWRNSDGLVVLEQGVAIKECLDGGGCMNNDECDDGDPCNGDEVCVKGVCQSMPPDPDCNGNGVLDSCDIASGTSTDANGNGVPDDCDVLCAADVDNDGTVGIDDFLAVLAAWGACR